MVTVGENRYLLEKALQHFPTTLPKSLCTTLVLTLRRGQEPEYLDGYLPPCFEVKCIFNPNQD
jgi:hypothetical protein